MNRLPVSIIAAATTVSDVLQAAAMKRHGEIRDFRLGALRRFSPCWRAINCPSPISASLAKYLLKEPVTLGRWAGASLVACGVALRSQ